MLQRAKTVANRKACFRLLNTKRTRTHSRYIRKIPRQDVRATDSLLFLTLYYRKSVHNTTSMFSTDLGLKSCGPIRLFFSFSLLKRGLHKDASFYTLQFFSKSLHEVSTETGSWFQKHHRTIRPPGPFFAPQYITRAKSRRMLAIEMPVSLKLSLSSFDRMSSS